MTAKSDRVEKLLQDPDLQQAFLNIRERYRDMIEEAPVSSDDGDVIHDIRKMLHLLREVEQDLHNELENGRFEDFRAQEQEGHQFLGDIYHGRSN